ncbi:hypothetical protein PENARI_c011G04902 [Penicillium arizonense]|uniref:AMP-dependent synthetase/ligase domain-containing protein n=1 Tax=Penicillium arizonense TaxID=1835702 RepID=A0A1F5LGC4_PENAI|nr:hypothetical protein PENARI_c011G04902 [Penicillium arizonense]OGE52126.1 hypothetical protein PENARI_c011G04902 [Penicillium arizonense]
MVEHSKELEAAAEEGDRWYPGNGLVVQFSGGRRPLRPVELDSVCAEAPSLEVVRQWIRADKKVYTIYGPSETTCLINFGELDPDKEVPFGDLIPGVRVILVDENLQERDHGEVLIAGPGLAAGYLDNPTLKATNFIEWNGERFYRTGDLARRTKTGELV